MHFNNLQIFQIETRHHSLLFPRMAGGGKKTLETITFNDYYQCLFNNYIKNQYLIRSVKYNQKVTITILYNGFVMTMVSSKLVLVNYLLKVNKSENEHEDATYFLIFTNNSYSVINR